MSNTKSKPTPLPEPYILQVACIALEELYTLEIQPDIFVDPTIMLSCTARALLHDIAAQFTPRDRLLLCCIKWEFNSNKHIDRSWALYFWSQSDQYPVNPTHRYNQETGENITSGTASLRFIRMKEKTENRLGKEYSMRIARTFFQLGSPIQSDTEYIEYLCNQAYEFCLACVNDTNSNLKRPLLKHWYDEGLGWADMRRSISELKRVIPDTDYLSMPANFRRAFKLATVAYCGLVIQDRSGDEKDKQNRHLLVTCLQRLCERDEKFQGRSLHPITPQKLKDYLRYAEE